MDEIQTELNTRVPNTVAGVSKFETLRSKRDEIAYNLFLVRLFPGIPATEILKIRHLFYTRVNSERPRGNKGPMQCT